MVLEFFRGGGASPMDHIHGTLVQMLRDGNEVFVTAADALFGGGKSKETRHEVRSTDRGINEAQGDIRRSLLTHASVTPADLPLVLQYASIVKDAERIGDYAKNLYDLVRYGVDFSTYSDEDELATYRDAVSMLILDAAEIFDENDTDRADHLIAKADAFLDDYDAHIKDQFSSADAGHERVAKALYFRFLKRITAHVMNVLTALVKPLDRLDYYDEDPADR
jgi:phosphate transport system protein